MEAVPLILHREPATRFLGILHTEWAFLFHRFLLHYLQLIRTRLNGKGRINLVVVGGDEAEMWHCGLIARAMFRNETVDAQF